MTLTASDRGVTADSVSLTTISDPGFVGVPGLNQELFDASTVFTKWCNSLGGINGRKIIDNQRDAAVVNYKAQVQAGCQGDFALVGGGGVFDDTGQSTRLACLLPDFAGYSVSAAARAADLNIQAMPNPLGSLNIGIWRLLAATYPSSVSRVGYLTGNLNTLILEQQQYQEGATQAGLHTVWSAQYNAAGEVNWTPLAQAIKAHRVQGLVWLGEGSQAAKLEQAMQTIGYYPQWITVTGNVYDPSFIKLGGTALKNTYLALWSPPYTATQIPAVADYYQLFRKYLPHGKSAALLGWYSFSSWLLFARAAKACGANLTRKCAFDNAEKVTTWDAGGLTAPANPAKSIQPACFAAVSATPGGFKNVDVHPTDGIYNCNPDNIVTLNGDYGSGATLKSVGKSMADLP